MEETKVDKNGSDVPPSKKNQLSFGDPEAQATL